MKIKVQITRQENATYFNAKVNDIVEVEFEEYVAAVTASEIGNGQLEACKAQAVAARTFAVSRGVLYDAVISDASSTAQAYRAKRYNKNSYPRCIEAAEATKGEILLYDKKPITAVFSSNNGGRTVSAEERWGSKRAYLIEKDDPWDAAAGDTKTGHGVGMSQRGASYAAKIGKTYKEILAFYYPGTVLETNYGQYRGVVMSNVTDKVVEKAKSLLGSPYVWGATGEKCTVANRKKRLSSSKLTEVSKTNIKKRCPILSGKQKTCSGCKYEGMNEYDCIGFVNAVNKACGINLIGAGATYHWGNKSNFVRRGPISEMPNVVCCVYQGDGTKMSHIGFHIGNGEIIHCSGSGEVKYGKVSDTGWAYYAIPVGYYTEEELKEAKVVSNTIGSTVLKKGMQGNDVLQLQVMLNVLGYDCGEPDGVFGTKTFNAVKAFQKANNITVDGKAGPVTNTLIESLYDEALGIKDDEEEKEEVPEEEEEIPEELYDMLNMIKEQLNALQAQVELIEKQLYKE